MENDCIYEVDDSKIPIIENFSESSNGLEISVTL